MAKLLVRLKDGTEREMSQKVYDLIGFKRKPTIIGKAKETEELSEIEKIKADLRAQKAANKIEEPTLTLPKEDEKTPELPKQEVKEKAKPGPKPKTV